MIIRARLRFWIWVVMQFDRWSMKDSEAYYWVLLRAAACNAERERQ